jgi:hypothetical protein
MMISKENGNGKPENIPDDDGAVKRIIQLE